MLRTIATAAAVAALAAGTGAGCSKSSEDAAKHTPAPIDLPSSNARSAGPIKRKIDQVAPPAGVDLAKPPADAITTKDGLVFKSLADGTGDAPSKNDTVTIDYTGWHANGETFYSTKSRGKPLTLPLSNVATGFVEAITMMKKGGHAVFWLPP